MGGDSLSHKTRQIIWQNIIFAMVAKAVFIVLVTLGIATLWEAVFADVGVALGDPQCVPHCSKPTSALVPQP